MAPSDRQPDPSPSATANLDEVPLAGSRQEAVQRLQIGLAGVAGILLLIGLASIINESANRTEANSVPQAAATNVPEDEPLQADPLAEAGVVPAPPPTPAVTPTPTVPVIPPPAGQAEARAD